MRIVMMMASASLEWLSRQLSMILRLDVVFIK